MIRAVIDLGTNSLKCVIAEVGEGSIRVLEELLETTRLGGELATSGRIGPEAIRRCLSALGKFKRRCNHFKVEQAVCVGAETLRRAADAGELELLIQAELNWRLHTLSQQEEAALIYQASAPLAGAGSPLLVIDSGGGSTEFSFGNGEAITGTHSLPLGAVTLTREFVASDPIAWEDLDALQQHVRESLRQTFPAPETRVTIASGGGLNALAAVALVLKPYDPQRVHGFRLSREEVLRQITLYGSLDLAARIHLPGLPSDRADIILAGAVLIAEVMGHFSLGELTVSTRGLRHALLADEDFWLGQKPLPVCTRHNRQIL